MDGELLGIDTSDWDLRPQIHTLSVVNATRLIAGDDYVLVFARQQGLHGYMRCQGESPVQSDVSVLTTSAPLSVHLPRDVMRYTGDDRLCLGVLRVSVELMASTSRQAFGRDLEFHESTILHPHRLLSRRLNEYFDRALDPVDPPSTLEMNARAVLVITKVLRDFSTSAQGPSRQDGGLPAWRVRQIQAYVESNLSEMPSLDELASLAGLSRFHFCRAFKMSTGVSPIRWIHSKRMQVAQGLVVGTSEALIDIAARLGYRSVAHFSRVFTDHHGTPPSALRRRG